MNRYINVLVILVILITCNYKINTTVHKESKNLNSKNIVDKKYINLQKVNQNNDVGIVKDIPFYKELLSKLNHTKDTIYIYSRYLLEKFNVLEKLDSIVKFGYKQQYEVTIIIKSFNKNIHSLDLVDTIRKSNSKIDYFEVKNFIDNHRAYGIDGDTPKTELSELIIGINQKIVKIPHKYFNDIYNINLKYTEVYYNLDKNLIFIYINGGDGAGGYSAKYVIDKHGYITRIITDLCGFDFIDGINYDCV